MDKNILLFGTSADPIHNGHVEMVISCVNALKHRNITINEIILMPVYRRNPIDATQKNSLPSTYEIRFKLCQIASKEIKERLDESSNCVLTSRLEEQLGRNSDHPSYTFDTLETLQTQYGSDASIFLLLGSDPFSGEKPSFDKWFKSQEIINKATIVICPRADFPVNTKFIELLISCGAKVVYLKDAIISKISSSEIKLRLCSGEQINKLIEENIISEAAARYLQDSGLVEYWKSNDLGVIKPPIEGKDKMYILENKIGKLLIEKGLTLALAESCTGGLIGHRITNVAGSSAYFLGSIVAYAYEAKVKLLGVNWDTLKNNGAVSCETVIEMAIGARQALDADIGLSVCCIAGPGGATPTKPVGTGRIGLSSSNRIIALDFFLESDRIHIKEAIAEAALQFLLDFLSGKSL